MPNESVKKIRTVSQREARWKCPEETFSFETSAQAEEFKGVVGQKRALESMLDGMRNDYQGYNIFISGDGSGKEALVDHVLKDTLKLNETEVQLEDVLYVHNFKKPDEPKFIYTKAGQGREFASDMEHIVESVLRIIKRTIESDSVYMEEQLALHMDFIAEAKELPAVKELNEKLKGHNIFYNVSSLEPLRAGAYHTSERIQEAIDVTKRTGTDVGTISSVEDFAATLDKEDFAKFKAKFDEFDKVWSKVSGSFKHDIQIVGEEIASMREKYLTEMEKLAGNYILPQVEALTNPVNRKYNNKAISEFLDDFLDYLGNNLKDFELMEQKKREIEVLSKYSFMGKGDLTQQAIIQISHDLKDAPCFKVNVFVDNSGTKGVPIKYVRKATMEKVFGEVKTESMGGLSARTNHMMIEAGDIHRARGGVLILDAEDLLTVSGLWLELKNTLKTGKTEIYSGGSIFRLHSLEPEEIDCSNTKVIVVGDSLSYALFDYLVPEDFHKIFKIRAETATMIDNTPEQCKNAGRALAGILKKKEFLPFDRSALSDLMEYSVRLADDQKKLSAKLDKLVDIASEANAIAREKNESVVKREHIELALEKKHYRMAAIEDRIQEMINDGVLIVDTEDSRVGQINGVAVLSTGGYSFGIPHRITATTSVGAPGSVSVLRSVEKEADQSGQIHTRSVKEAENYIREMFGQDKVLALYASLAFEQLYSGIDGDSASVPQTVAVLSNLADVPVKQNIVATGSHDQKGYYVQPIGGLNQKIEGVYKTFKTARERKTAACQEGGDYHFIFPIQNLSDLQLHPDVVASLYDEKENPGGWFHLHPVEHISEAVEIFTDVKFDDVLGKADEKLRGFSKIATGKKVKAPK